jgi:hypothetical protein
VLELLIRQVHDLSSLVVSTRIGKQSYRQVAKEAGISLAAVNWNMNGLSRWATLPIAPLGRRLVNSQNVHSEWLTM